MRSSQIFGSEPVGSIRQFAADVETLSGGQWLLADGRSLLRSAYPQIEARYPNGGVVSTVRTSSANVGYAAACDGTNFLIPSTTGTDCLQASADGITWSLGSGWAASTAFPCIIVAGSRFIAAPSAGESQPHVIATGGSAANLGVKGNWTATTGADIAANCAAALAYSSTLGRTVMIKANTGNSWYLDDGSTAWTACSGGSSTSNSSVVWTGQKFIKFETTGTSNRYQTSTDGITWADAYTPFYFSPSNSALPYIASNGAGTVVLSANTIFVAGSTIAAGLLVTTDHGATWKVINASNVGADGAALIYYVNGEFVGIDNGANVASVDGIHWVPKQFAMGGILYSTANTSITYNSVSGVYLLAAMSGTTVLTAVDDPLTFAIPAEVDRQITAVGTAQLGLPYYIKVK